jgi:hypothetical protein
MLDDILIRAEDIVELLTQLPYMTLEKAVQLLDCSDKQNVPKAVNSLQSLLKLKGLPASLDPTTEHRRKAIISFAEILGYFVQPFIMVHMSLSEQVESLATFAFGAAYLYIVHGNACFTGPLYANTQSVVKNLIFTIAHMQQIDSDMCLYIIHEGTDRLEGLFADTHTLDHVRNFDIDQLSGKLSVATLINAAFECNPDLDCGHC